jgi:hypothetical protein
MILVALVLVVLLVPVLLLVLPQVAPIGAITVAANK